MKKFEDLSLKGQKMRIVKDAISQIEGKKFLPKEGTYLQFLQEDDLSYYPSEYESIQKTIQKRNCECCAKGAIFASCILNINKVKGKDAFNDESFMKSKLKKWFTALELDMIEAAFETEVISNTDSKLEEFGEDDYGSITTVLTELGKKCVKFGEKYKSPKGRLLGILNNILKNGEFKP